MSSTFEIVAHRGVASDFPENTIASFQLAAKLGADGVEFDVRLTKDHIPVVYHYHYLEAATNASGTIFDYNLVDLQDVVVLGSGGHENAKARIPTLVEVLETLGEQIGMEIELKGPEPEAPRIVAAVLNEHKPIWPAIEVTSFQPALLLEVQKQCPGITCDLLFPRSEDWMKLDVVAYRAAQLARLAQARAVHLHPSQLSQEVVDFIRSHQIDVHAWDINDEAALQLCADLAIPRFDTDQLRQALKFREGFVKYN